MLSGETTVSILFYLPSVKRSILKGKNLLSLGANSFYFQSWLSVQKSKQKVI